MRKTSSQARLINNNGGLPISSEYGVMIGYGQSRDVHKKIDQSTGGFGSSKDWLSGEGSGVLTTRANSFRGPSDPASSSYANEQQSRGYRAMRDASRGSVTGSTNQVQSSRPKLKVDVITESSKAHLRTDDPKSSKESRTKPASRRSSKQGSTSSKSRSKIRSLSFKAVEQLAQAGAAQENRAGQDQKLINEIIILALANAGMQPPRSEEDLTQMVSQLSMLNILNAYDQLIKGTKNHSDGAAVDSLQATRIYRQLLKLHRQGQDAQGKPSGTPAHPPQPGQSAPFRPPIAPSTAHDSIDYLPEKQMKDQPLPSDLLSASSSSQALNIEVKKPTGAGKRKPEELLEEQFERLMEKERKRKENKAQAGGKPPKDKGQPADIDVCKKKPEQSSRNVTKSKYQMTTSISKDDILKMDSDQKSGNLSARFSQKMLQPNPEAGDVTQKRGGALASATQSFPDFHLKPDISHFAQDKFNLRVTLHDESSLFMNDSVEDCREPEAQMIKELRSQAQKQEGRGPETKVNNFVNHLDNRVLKAKEAYLKQLGKAEQLSKNQPKIADGTRSITHSSPRNDLAIQKKRMAQKQNFQSTQDLYSVKNKQMIGQRSQDKFKRADLDHSTEGKNTFSLSKGSENNTSKYMDAVKSNYQSHIGSLMNADLNFDGAPSLAETDEFAGMHATIPEPTNPPDPIQQTELPMMVTLGQGQSEEQLHDTSEIRATMHSALINIVQQESPFKQAPAPKQPPKPPLLEVSKTSSKPLNRLKASKPLKSSGQSARLQFKRPRSSTGSAKDTNETSNITSGGSAVIPAKIHRLNSARGGAPRPAPAPTEGILKKKDLQKQLSELDLEIERERLELRRMSQEAAQEAKVTNTARSTRDDRDQQQMLEVLHLQNEKLMELAQSHWRFVVSGKVLSTLASNRAMQRRQRQLEDVCLIYRKTRLLTTSFNSLKYFVQIVVREERTLDLAAKHHRIGVKARVFKELMKNVSKKMITRVQLEQAKRQLSYSKKRRLFNHILSYSASKAIKKAQKRQAFEKRRFYLLREAFTTLRLHCLTQFNLNLMYQKAAIYHANNILKQSFTILLENSSRLRYERHLDELRGNFQHQRQSLQDLKLSVFIALQKYTLKQKHEKKALLFYRSLLLRRSFIMFVKGVQIHRNYTAQKTVSTHLYSHKLMQITFTALLDHISKELTQVRRFADILAAGKRRRAFRGLKQSVARRNVASWMKSPAGIRCARLMLKASFGDLMEQVWDRQPGQKIERCREVQAGRVEMMLVNYLAVSKSHKYCNYFIEVNKILLRDLQKRAFRSLRINLLRVRQFQQRKHRRHLRLCFRALLKGVQGERLVDQYIGSMIKLRNMKLLKKVFKGMKTTTKELARLDNACCLILQQRKERIIRSSMRTWALRYAEAKKCRDLDTKAEKFLRSQLVNKHMTIWIRKLAQKMKKKHLVANVMPLVKTRITARPYFAKWLQAYKKNCYLEQQLESIDNFQNQELVQKYFGVLKQYTRYRQRKNHKTAMGRQQYVYYLGKRVFQSLLMNLKLQLNKQYLNTNIRLDYELRLKQKVLSSLRSYAHYRIDRRLSDHVLIVQATKIHQAYLFKQWQNRCRRRQCMKYIESILDEARQRKAFQKVKEFAMRMEACEEVVMVNKDALHLKRQYFCEFVRLVQKKNELIEKGMFLREHSKPLLAQRMFNQWKRRYQQRQDEYSMFFFVVLQLKRQTLKTYFKQLRQHALMSRLKKTSPLIHVDSLLRKSLRAFKLNVLTKQRHRTITKLITQGRSARLKRGSLLIWTERTWQAEVLHLRLNQWRLSRQALLWNAWQATVQESQSWKQRRQQAQQEWALRQRCKAVNHWKEWAITRQVDREKEYIALQFHEQRVVQEVVRVWCRAVPENRGDRQRLRAVKKSQDQRIVRQALQVWMQRASKALSRVRGAKLVQSIGERRIVMQAVMKMLSNVQEQREMERMADEMHEILKERRVVRAFQAMRGYVNLQKDQKDRLLHVNLYYDQKMKAKTLEQLTWYVQSQKDKREMKEIAAAQRASTLLRTSFLKLRTRWEQGNALRLATRMFEERQRVKNGKLVMNRMTANMRWRRERTILQSKAQMFRQFKTYEKVFRGIFTFCVQKASSSLQKEKARSHHQEVQLRQYFDVLRNYSIERKLLQQKRNMLFQVISTIDQQQLLQNSFDSLFRHLVNSTNDVSSAQYQLRLQKMQRMYRILLFHVSKKKAMRQLQQIVKGKNEQNRRAHFFLAWRKQSLQEQVVGERRRNQDMVIVEKVFGVLRRRWELKTKVDFCIMEKRVKMAKKCFGALVKNVGLKQDKDIKKQGAAKNFQMHLKMRAWRSLAWQAHRGARLNQVRHAKRARTLKRGLSEWFRLASLRHQQRGILLYLVSKRDKENKLVAFKIMQRVAFMKKMCSIFESQKKMTRQEQREHQLDVQVRAFTCLKTYAKETRRLRNIELQIKSKNQRQTQKLVMKCLKHFSRSHLLCLKMHRAINPKLKSIFESIKDYAEKEAALEQLENEVRDEKRFRTKNRILYQWALLLDKRENIAKFIANRQYRRMHNCFRELKKHYIQKQLKLQKQQDIIEHFARKRPQCLHMFSKAFLLLNHEVVKVQGPQAPSFGGNSTLPPLKNILNSEHSVFDDQESVNNNQIPSSSGGSQAGIEHAPEGVPMCGTVLAKYTLEKWKLAMDGLRRRNQLEQLSQDQFAYMTLSKTFREWRTRSSIKVKERRLLEHGREFRDEVLIKKSFEILVEYMHKRKNIRQLNTIGKELRSIRTTQQMHKMLVSWYDATVEVINTEKKFDGVVETFVQMQQGKYIPLTFNALKEYTQQKIEKRKIKEDLNSYAEQVYVKNLLRRTMAAMKEQVQEESDQARVSKLFPIFQAWKFHVKENSLLKKYLSQAEQRSMKDESSVMSCEDEDKRQPDEPLNNMLASSQAPTDPLQSTLLEGDPNLKHDLLHSLYDQGMLQSLHEPQHLNGAGPINPLLLDSKLSITDIETSLAETGKDLGAVENALKLSFMKKDGANQ